MDTCESADIRVGTSMAFQFGTIPISPGIAPHGLQCSIDRCVGVSVGQVKRDTREISNEPH